MQYDSAFAMTDMALPLNLGITGGFVMAGRFTHILVPTDFNPASDAALACAKELAARFDARLTLLHAVNDPMATGVWTPDVYVPATPEMQDKFLRAARERLEGTLSAEERARFAVAIEARTRRGGRDHRAVRARPESRPDRHGHARPPRPFAHAARQCRRASGPTRTVPRAHDACGEPPEAASEPAA